MITSCKIYNSQNNLVIIQYHLFISALKPSKQLQKHISEMTIDEHLYNITFMNNDFQYHELKQTIHKILSDYASLEITLIEIRN